MPSIVPSSAVLHSRPHDTPAFLKTTAFVLRLHKLAPSSEEDESEASVSEADEDSDAAEGCDGKKRRAGRASDEPPAKRCRREWTRVYEALPCPEVYTTASAANDAAFRLQSSMMGETPAGQAWKAANEARLRNYLAELEENRRLWSDTFNVGIGVKKFELEVKVVDVRGPRNV